MNLKNTTKLDDLGKILFAEGWFFFIPYLFFYLVFKYLQLKLSTLENIFLILHVFNTLILIYYLYKILSNNHISKLLFWLCIILLFQIPGAYLEFPSDAWEHFRRIFEWQKCVLVDDHSTNYKFTYFWGWTLMSEVQPIYRRVALDIYSTFWQFLLAYQFYLFALRIGFSESWAKVQVLGTICLFGTNVFSFYRYYALSSTPLAYIAYLRSLIIILDFFDGKRKKTIEFIFLIPIIYYNHYQELLLLIISFFAIYIANFYRKNPAKLNKKNIYKTIAILILCFFIGTFSVTFFQKYALLITKLWNSYLQNYFTEKTPTSLLIEPNYWSNFGLLRIWDKKLPYFQTLGIYGYISMLFSLIFWNKYKVLSTLTFFPLLLLFFQPFTLFLATLEGHYTTFRVLFALPYSLMLVVGFKEIFTFFSQKFSINKYVVIIFLLIFLSLQSNLPWRGRLWHQLYQTPAQLSLKNIDITAQWFFKNRPLKNHYVNAHLLLGNPQIDAQCLLVTDNATSFSLVTHLGLQFQGNQRLYPYNPSQNINTFDSLKNYLKSENNQKLCGFLVGIRDRINPPPISKVGQLSNHWLPDIVKQDFNYTKEFVEITEFLTLLGWTKTFVPPFYLLYEAPLIKSSQDSSTMMAASKYDDSDE